MARVRRAARADAADDGFTLIEVIVATGIFTVISVATLTLLMTAIRTVGENRDRIVAASVARGEVESLRALGAYSAKARVDATPSSPVTPPGSQKVFTVTRTATWVPLGASSACDSTVNPREALLSLRVDVGGGSLGSPQRVETLIHTFNAKGGTQGSVTVRVNDSTGVPLAGATVTGARGSTSFSQVTGTAGCVFVPALTAGSWSLSVSSPGYTPSPSTTTATVAGGQNTAVPTVTLTRLP